MDPKKVRELLENVANGRTAVDTALEKLRDLPFADLGFASVDHHRAMRLGLPEVVFGPGKSIEQLIAIIREIDSHDQPVLATRIAREQATALLDAIPAIEYDPVASTAVLARKPVQRRGRGTICIVTAGTSDIPVASEAAVTAGVGRRSGVDA